MIRDYLAEMIEPSLLLGLLCSLTGIAAAVHYGSINIFYSVLVVIGSVLAQMSVNLFDDYEDYISGLDKETIKTKFSGGSHLVVSGKVHFRHVIWLTAILMLIAGLIGLYLALAVNIIILVLMIIGTVAILFYTKYITALPLFAEPIAMLAFALIGIGSFIVAHGSLSYLGDALFTTIPAGMLCGIVLLVNEIPDAEIDKKYGRKHAVIILKNNKTIAAYYFLLMVITYLIVIFGVAFGIIPVPFLLVAITLPLVLYIALGIDHYKTPLGHERYMAINIVTVLIYLTILVIAYSL